MNHLQENTSKNVHEHSFSNIISKLFLDCHCVWLRSLCRLKLECLVFCLLTHPIFQDGLCRFFFTKLGFPHPTVHNIFLCICGQSINSTRIHLFCCVHKRKHMVTHDAIHKHFTSIVRDAKFHVLCKQTHLFLGLFLQSSW